VFAERLDHNAGFESLLARQRSFKIFGIDV